MIIFFDCEVFSHDWLIVFKMPQTNEKVIIHNNRDELIEFHEKHKNNVFLGYNVRGYDQYILKSVILGLNPKEVNDFIIKERRFGWEFSDSFRDVQLYFFDCILKGYSLKQLEGFMGSSMVESDVPFDIDRPLTESELKSTIDYCEYDVDQLIEVFKHTKEEYESHVALIKAFHLSHKFISKTKPQLSAIILEASKQSYNDEFKITIPDNLEIRKYKHIVDWYKEPDNMDYKKHQDEIVDGVPHKIAWGGIHGAVKHYIGEGTFLHVDVSSFYPAIMIGYNFLSRNVANKDKYAEIRDKRLELKANKDATEKPMKIVLRN